MSLRRLDQQLHRDEGGATVVIVALCLVALIGMLVLVVDVGGLLWKRREMVNGADAAALAAAETCAVDTVADPSDPQAQADTAAVNNVNGLVPQDGGIIATNGCDQATRPSSGYVTTQYSQPQQLFFAGIFGKSQQSVTTQATAAWGPLSGGRGVPIVLENGFFQSGDCNVPTVQVGTTCAFWYDNPAPSTGTGGIGVGGFGFLNLDTWGIDPTSNGCNNATDLDQYILNNYTGSAPINLDVNPTYVCLDHGAQHTNWFKALCERWNGVMQTGASTCTYLPVPPNSTYSGWPGRTILQPVNDCSQQVDNTGTVVPCSQPYSKVDKFAIVGFTSLTLGIPTQPTVPAVIAGNDPLAIGTPGTAATNGDCGNNGTALGNPPLGGWDLTMFASTNCGAPRQVDTIWDGQSPHPAISVKRPGNGPALVRCAAVSPLPSPSGCDWYYDATTHVLSWVNPVSRDPNNKVSFDWTINGTAGTPGYCGIRKSDPNAMCIVATWEGYQALGGTIGDANDFGTRAVVLCDFTYSSCPPIVKP